MAQKVADAYKLDKARKRTFRPLGSIAYDERILRWQVDKERVSLWTVRGRLTLPFVCGQYQREMLRTQQGETDLAFVEGNFYLLGVCEVDEPPAREVGGVLGIDLGIVNLATDSEGRHYSGETVRFLRRRMKRLRSGLQHQAKKHKSRSAARHLARVRRRVSRFTRWVNHNISRRLVGAAAASGKAIALEDLKGIRERASAMSREMRLELGNWAFHQLGEFIGYKAARAGIPVVFVDPRNTSRTCPACGHCDKANRKSQSQFKCLRCGRVANADTNAALNIAARGRVTCPMDG
jgi:IS605 OrfB family transposase